MSDKIRSTSLALGVLSPGRERMMENQLCQATLNPLASPTTGKSERKSMKHFRKGHSVFKSLSIMLLGIFLAACSTQTPEGLEPQAVKQALLHYPLGTSKIHWLDPELYLELQKIAIQMGGAGSPREVDALYDSRH